MLWIEKLYDARSLFRMFKFLLEVKRIQIILQYIKTTDNFTLIMNVSSRAFYFMYWIFDNLYIITKIINVKSSNLKNQGFQVQSQQLAELSKKFWKISRIWWLLGIVMFLIYCIKTLRKTYTDESDLKVAALDKMTVQQLKQNLEIISQLRGDYWLNFNRALYDLLICLNENELFFHILGKRLNRGNEGVFGMASSLIYLWSLLKF